MAGQPPFSKKDAAGIRRAAGIILYGGTVRTPAFKELVREYGHKAYFYAYCVDLFFGDVDVEHGNILRYPFSGGSVEQPAGTREAWSIMRSVLNRKIADDRKRASKG